MQFCRGSNMYMGIAEIMADLADGVIEMCAGPCVNSDISPGRRFWPRQIQYPISGHFTAAGQGWAKEWSDNHSKGHLRK